METDLATQQVFEKHERDMEMFIDKHYSSLGSAMSAELIKHLMEDLLTGVNELHQNNVVHRDLKPQNILIPTKPNDKPVLRIADLGLAKNLTMPVSTHTYEVMTLLDKAPEILRGGHYTYQIDMWSVGCIFAEFFLGVSLDDSIFGHSVSVAR
ncbi:hypothetical protein BSKO_05884 [Bryopsis sp. KO-2023]|nr:hypothetical protein BSKO_05884 [Bryopsis sp. KO-2023]